MVEDSIYNKTYTLQSVNEVATQLIDLLKDRKIWAFVGNLGSGKTTLIKYICQHLGYTELVNSPTFSLVNVYPTNDNAIYHFDFYRIKQEQEALDIGLYEYLDSGNLCLIEWPEMIKGVLSNENVAYIHLSYNDDIDTRTIYVSEKL